MGSQDCAQATSGLRELALSLAGPYTVASNATGTPDTAVAQISNWDLGSVLDWAFDPKPSRAEPSWAEPSFIYSDPVRSGSGGEARSLHSNYLFPTLPPLKKKKMPYQTFTPPRLAPVHPVESEHWEIDLGARQHAALCFTPILRPCPQPRLSNKHMWPRSWRWSACSSLSCGKGLCLCVLATEASV